MYSCILLAAGLSSRFGSLKALTLINQKPAITHILLQLVNSPCEEIIVVLGAHIELINPHVLNHKQIKIVYNKDYLLGQTSSFKTGLQASSDLSAGFFLWPVDCPFIQPTTIESLINEANNSSTSIIIPTYQNQKGHPPLFKKDLKEDLLNHPTSEGLNKFIHSQQRNITYKECPDNGVTLSFNTPKELETILSEQPSIDEK